MSERDRYPQDRDPFDNLRDLIDQPATPRQAFADELRSRLMRELSASEFSREEHSQAMNAVSIARPPLAFPIESPRRIRPMVILELAAAAIIILGLAATVGRGWFQNDPDAPTSVPAAALQGDGTPTPDATMPPTVEPSVVPPGNLAGTLWTIPGPDGDLVDFGGLLVEDGTVFRLIATTGFVGIQAVNSDNGTVEWQQAYQWTGNLFALENDTLYFDGGDNQLIAVNAETGVEQWRAQVAGNPIAIAEQNDRIFVLLDTDFVTALDEKTGDQLWLTQGTGPRNPTGGSASVPAIGKIAVENDVVAAVSTYGVLSGFDLQTGKELWTLEGFDAATFSITTENDRFVVIDGAGPETAVGFGVGSDEPVTRMACGTPDEAGAGSAAFATVGGANAAEKCGAVVGKAGTAAGDGGVSISGATESEAADGTPEAGASVSGMTGLEVRVQGIDPKTGEVIWAQATAPRTVGGSAQGSSQAGTTAEICAVDVESGAMTSVSPAGSPAAGAASMESGQVTVGSMTGGVCTPVQAAESGQPISIGISVGSIEGLDEPPVAVAADESGIYLQLQDGSLVKVDAGQVQGEAGHQESSDDDGQSGTTESDDD